jgi:hypothetical protein
VCALVVNASRLGQGVLVVGETGFADAILWAKNPAMLADLMTQYEVPADAPTVTL